MLDVSGDSTTREYDAAVELKHIILRSWPNVADDSTHQIRIVAGAKCYGQSKRDIDILLLASFGAGLTYSPDRAFSTNRGKLVRPDEVLVSNICAAIEVKDHLPEKIRFEGSRVLVSYQEGWKDVTEQNGQQIYSVKRYIEYHGYTSPWVTNFIWLRNFPTENLPQTLHNILGFNLTWERFLNIMGQLYPPKLKSHVWVLASAPSPDIIARAVDLFTKPLEPTKLLDEQGQEIVHEQIVPESQRHAGWAARERELARTARAEQLRKAEAELFRRRAQIAEDERLRKAEVELLRNRKAWGQRNAEEGGSEQEGENLPLANHLRLVEKEEQLREASEEEKSLLLANHLHLVEEEPLRKASEEGKSPTPPLNASYGIRAPMPSTIALLRRDVERYLANRQYKEARETLSYAIQLTPNDSSLHNDMGYVLIMLGRFPEALDAASHAIRLNPNNIALKNVSAKKDYR